MWIVGGGAGQSAGVGESVAYEREREVAVGAAIAAAVVCERVRSALTPEHIMTKADGSPATVADYASQAVIIAALRQAFPADPIAAEETSAALRESSHATQQATVQRLVTAVIPGLSAQEILDHIDGGSFIGGPGRFWTVDPIDGTKGFVRGGQYAVAIALIEDGELILGVLACPNLPADPGRPLGPRGCVLAATAGCGASQRALGESSEGPARVDAIDDPRAARVCVPVERSSASPAATTRVLTHLSNPWPPMRIDSQAKYAVVARGDASVYMRLSGHKPQNIWDHAAGVIVLREAGGTVTDTLGNPLRFSSGRVLTANQGILASNGALHNAFLAAIRRDPPNRDSEMQRGSSFAPEP